MLKEEVVAHDMRSSSDFLKNQHYEIGIGSIHLVTNEASNWYRLSFFRWLLFSRHAKKPFIEMR